MRKAAKKQDTINSTASTPEASPEPTPAISRKAVKPNLPTVKPYSTADQKPKTEHSIKANLHKRKAAAINSVENAREAVTNLCHKITAGNKFRRKYPLVSSVVDKKHVVQTVKEQSRVGEVIVIDDSNEEGGHIHKRVKIGNDSNKPSSVENLSDESVSGDTDIDMYSEINPNAALYGRMDELLASIDDNTKQLGDDEDYISDEEYERELSEIFSGPTSRPNRKTSTSKTSVVNHKMPVGEPCEFGYVTDDTILHYHSGNQCICEKRVPVNDFARYDPKSSTPAPGIPLNDYNREAAHNAAQMQKIFEDGCVRVVADPIFEEEDSDEHDGSGFYRSTDFV